MPNSPEPAALDLTEMTATLVSAYVSNNSVQAAGLCDLIIGIHQTLKEINKPTEQSVKSVEKLTPAQIKKSITPDALISFEDGQAYKTLRRHLTTRGLTPETYRAKWGLPADYPTVAKNYSAQRTALALALGLGQLGRHTRKTTTAAAQKVPDKSQKQGRRRKAL